MREEGMRVYESKHLKKLLEGETGMAQSEPQCSHW